MARNGQKIAQEAQEAVELDWEISQLQEAKVDEAATHRSLMSAAAVQPSWNSSSRWRQSRQSSRFSSGCLTCSSSQRQATIVHQGPLRTARKRAITHEEGAGEQWEEEERNAAKRKCGERTPGGRNQGFPADFFNAALPPSDDEGEGDGGEETKWS